MLPAGITEYFLPSPVAPAAYEPVLCGSALPATRTRNAGSMSPHRSTPSHRSRTAPWRSVGTTPRSLTSSRIRSARAAANPAARYGALLAAARNAKSYTQWTDDFEQWLVRAKPLRLYSAPAQAELVRERRRPIFGPVQQAARERRDAAVEKLRGKAPRGLHARPTRSAGRRNQSPVSSSRCPSRRRRPPYRLALRCSAL